MTIKIGAGVRDNVSRRLGKVMLNPHGSLRGHIFVQWDGARTRRVVAIREVTLVSHSYECAKAWENGWKKKQEPADCRQERFWVTNP